MKMSNSSYCKKNNKIYNIKTKRCRKKCNTLTKLRSKRDKQHRCIIKNKQKICKSIGKTYNPKTRKCRKKCGKSTVRRGTRGRCVKK
jgi:hypothetical protein